MAQLLLLRSGAGLDNRPSHSHTICLVSPLLFVFRPKIVDCVRGNNSEGIRGTFLFLSSFIPLKSVWESMGKQ